MALLLLISPPFNFSLKKTILLLIIFKLLTRFEFVFSKCNFLEQSDLAPKSNRFLKADRTGRSRSSPSFQSLLLDYFSQN